MTSEGAHDELDSDTICGLSISLYSYKRTNIFQSTIITLLVNNHAMADELAKLSQFFKRLD